MKRALLMIALSFALAACGTSKSEAPAVDAGGDTEVTFGGARPVTVRVPAGYNPKKPAPLVMMLHGYSSSSALTELYFAMSSIADAHGFLYVAPNGLSDMTGSRFWNATDACCDFDHSGVDDAAYLTSVIQEVQAAYAVDGRRIYIMGHSNGGFMAHRLACDHAEIFAAAASFAGAVWSDAAKCNPSEPIGVLQIHGTKDAVVAYQGSAGMSAGKDASVLMSRVYPGAEQTIATWAKRNGCAATSVDAPMPIHVNVDGAGTETTVSRHEGCLKNGAAELWTVKDAPHIFVLTPAALEQIWSFFDAHAKAP